MQPGLLYESLQLPNPWADEGSKERQAETGQFLLDRRALLGNAGRASRAGSGKGGWVGGRAAGGPGGRALCSAVR